MEDVSVTVQEGGLYVEAIAKHPSLGIIGLVSCQEISNRTHYSENDMESLGPELYDEGVTFHPLVEGDTFYEYVSGHDFLELFAKDWNDFVALRKGLSKKPESVTVWGVHSSWVDRRFRGEALGQALYLHLMKYLAKKHTGVLVPNQSYESGGTSDSANRVWTALKKYPGVKYVGSVFWGGGVGDIQLRSRREREVGRRGTILNQEGFSALDP